MKKFEKFLINAIYIGAKGLFILFTLMFSLIAICALITVFTEDCLIGLLGMFASGILAYVNYSMI
jgi:hypothetical protein